MALTNSEILTNAFTAVGQAVKNVKTTAEQAQTTATEAKQAALQAQQSAQQLNTAVEQAIAAAKQEVKDDILGGAAADVDTLKEIADRLANSGQDTNAAMVQKMSEQNARIDAIEAVLNTDYVAIFNNAVA